MRGLRCLLGLLLLATGLVVTLPQVPPASAAWAAPQFVRTISGNGRPGVYPWGVQFNPVSNEVVVGDYLNNQIRRYTPDGKIIGSFYRPDATGQPYSIAIDPRQGDIYVPEIADGQPGNKIAQYSKTGTFIRALNLGTITYQAWISIDANGQLFQADSHYSNTTSNPPKVRIWRLSDGKALKSFNILPPGTTSSTVPRAYGIDTDATGNVWLTDTFNNRILKYSGTGSFLASYPMDGFTSGDARGMAVDDAHQRLYVSDSAGNQVEVFDFLGEHVDSFGGPGKDPLGLSSPRQPAVAPDGSLYIAEYGNARVHRYTADGTDNGYFPDPEQPAVAGQLGEPRDVDVDRSNGDVWVADSWNQRFQRFSRSGDFLGTWGNRSSSPTYGMNYPRGIAVDAQNDIVWIANQRGHHIKRYQRDGSFLDQLGNAESDDTNPNHFRWPLDIEIDGSRALVSDRNSSVVKILDAVTGTETGKFTRSGNHGLAVDPATHNIFVSDSTTSKIYILNPTGTTQLGVFGAPGTADGQFKHIWDMTIVGGVLYVTDDLASRVQAFSTGGAFLGKWGGFGSGAYQFKNPSGIASSAEGRLYVADAGNDRVVELDTTKVKGGGSWPAPVLTVAAPGNDASLPGAPVRLSGSVTDETGVATVEVAVQDLSSGEWFNASNSTWGTTQAWALSPYAGTSTKSVSFAWTFIGVSYQGRYRASFRATDAAGNVSAVSTRSFRLLDKVTSDTSAPTTYVTSPVSDGRVDNTPPIRLAGQVSDDVGVDGTQLNIRKVGINAWLQPDGSWGPFTWLNATLDDVGSVASGWGYAWRAPENGSYVLQARSTDVIGNIESPVVQQNFSVGDPDVTAPDGTVTSPTTNGSYVMAPMTVTGGATDDRAVGAVKVTIKNLGSNQWLQPDGSWGSAAAPLDAQLASPGAKATTWSYDWTPPAVGSYAVGLATTDTSDNPDPTKPWVTFSVVDVLDVEPPSVVVTSPAANATVPVDDATVRGTASDNLKVVKVEVGIKNRSTGQWLKADGTWGPTFVWVSASLSDPGTAATSWSRAWDATPGLYGYQVRVTDGAGLTAAKAFTNFTVS